MFTAVQIVRPPRRRAPPCTGPDGSSVQRVDDRAPAFGQGCRDYEIRRSDGPETVMLYRWRWSPGYSAMSRHGPTGSARYRRWPTALRSGRAADRREPPCPVRPLIERIWSDELPHRARNSLAGYLSRLRRVIARPRRRDRTSARRLFAYHGSDVDRPACFRELTGRRGRRRIG